MKHIPQVIDITEEEEADVKKSTTQPKVDSLKKLTKQITKYKRQLIKATSEEEQKTYKSQ